MSVSLRTIYVEDLFGGPICFPWPLFYVVGHLYFKLSSSAAVCMRIASIHSIARARSPTTSQRIRVFLLRGASAPLALTRKANYHSIETCWGIWHTISGKLVLVA